MAKSEKVSPMPIMLNSNERFGLTRSFTSFSTKSKCVTHRAGCFDKVQILINATIDNYCQTGFIGALDRLLQNGDFHATENRLQVARMRKF